MALSSLVVLLALAQTAADPAVGEAPPPMPFPPTEGKPLDELLREALKLLRG